ncbi:DMT family transporter [Dinoroseobacter shibae]|nr:DMT family transporter [Dinoroseobacter shibae]URF46167.1 DMT family transporter [Dinoroseobacter shibae]URF50474.1 DMT family transporter [Dinoroseobacter shibae]
MSMTYWLAIGAIALGGAGIALQAPINAQLARASGDPVVAAAISFGVGFVVLCSIVAVRGTVPGWSAMGGLPWWAWCGGALGAVYVWAAAWSVDRIGVVTLVAALVFGQLLTALLLDAIGAFGMAMREVSPTRIAAVVLVGAGLLLSRL